MNRKLKLLGANILMVLAVTAQPVAAKEEIFYNFEGKVPSPFTAQTDSFVKEMSFEIQEEQAGYMDRATNHYANLKFVPSDAASAAWMGADYESFGIEMIVRVEFDAMETGGCNLCRPIVYVGDSKPLKGSQFRPVGNSETPLSGTWQSFKYETTVKADRLIYIAMGGQAAKGMEMKTGSVGFDNVSLVIYPKP